MSGKVNDLNKDISNNVDLEEIYDFTGKFLFSCFFRQKMLIYMIVILESLKRVLEKSTI